MSAPRRSEPRRPLPFISSDAFAASIIISLSIVSLSELNLKNGAVLIENARKTTRIGTTSRRKILMFIMLFLSDITAAANNAV
jgi:hypothetical protein